MSYIIFLNGCGSCGKTSIAKSIQHLSDRPWLHIAMDTLIEMMPKQYLGFGSKAQGGYFAYMPQDSIEDPTVTVEVYPEGKKIFELLPTIARIFLENGNNLIIDEVLFADHILKSYIQAFQGHTTFFVGVFCDLESMQEREFLRGDRVIGLSKDQLNKVHTGHREYDVEVNTTHQSPFACAKQILTFFNDTPAPTGFQKMAAQLK